jgi:hypothetical protein
LIYSSIRNCSLTFTGDFHFRVKNVSLKMEVPEGSASVLQPERKEKLFDPSVGVCDCLYYTVYYNTNNPITQTHRIAPIATYIIQLL